MLDYLSLQTTCLHSVRWPAHLPAWLLLACLLQVLEYIEDGMPAESAVAFGLHPNAEIGFKLREAASFCDNLKRLQVRVICRQQAACYLATPFRFW